MHHSVKVIFIFKIVGRRIWHYPTDCRMLGWSCWIPYVRLSFRSESVGIVPHNRAAEDRVRAELYWQIDVVLWLRAIDLDSWKRRSLEDIRRDIDELLVDPPKSCTASWRSFDWDRDQRDRSREFSANDWSSNRSARQEPWFHSEMHTNQQHVYLDGWILRLRTWAVREIHLCRKERRLIVVMVVAISFCFAELVNGTAMKWCHSVDDTILRSGPVQSWFSTASP